MINQLKTAPLALKLIILMGLAVVALVACGLVGTIIFLALRPIPPSPGVVASPAPAESTVASAPPTAPPAVAMPTPGSPTATPPGEEITDPNYLQGKAAYQAKNYQEVLKLMDLVVQANPKLAPVYWYRGMAYFYLEDYQAGLEQMEQALALDPNYALGYADRGLMYASLGEDDRAMADWQKALALDPTLAKVHHNIGGSYHDKKDYELALKEYDAALAIDPGRASTWKNRAEIMLTWADFSTCIENASQAITLDPESWDSYYLRGTCQANLSQFELSLADLDVYLKAVQDDPQGWYNRGLVQRHLGNPQQAIADYSQALELNPQFAWALINRGGVYLEILKDYDKALADYNTALALGDIPAAYMGRGDVYHETKRYDEARADYQQALQLLPNYAAVYARLAHLYLDQQKYQDAIEAANQELTLDPAGSDKPITLQIRGRAYYGLGDYEKALEDQNWIITNKPTQADYYYRGLTYQALGQKAEAIADFELFLSSGGANDPEKIKDAEARLAELRQ